MFAVLVLTNDFAFRRSKNIDLKEGRWGCQFISGHARNIFFDLDFLAKRDVVIVAQRWCDHALTVIVIADARSLLSSGVGSEAEEDVCERCDRGHAVGR